MSTFPSSIREINKLPDAEKWAIYETLIPKRVIQEFDINLDPQRAQPHLRYVCPAGSRAMEIYIKRNPMDRDPLIYLNIADTFNQQLIVLLVVVNDPYAERFNVDTDQYGNLTNFGTSGRNLAAELAALKAGLAPGQIRRGLRLFREAVPVFEAFIQKMGHDIFMIEPLAYHNAIIFERYGFNYMRGFKDMTLIHEGFLPGGELALRLNSDNPFRQPRFANSIRGRSWAIHDGILGHPFTGFQMYKRVGHHAQVESFPDAKW